jgi:hypothetical protein
MKDSNNFYLAGSKGELDVIGYNNINYFTKYKIPCFTVEGFVALEVD